MKDATPICPNCDEPALPGEEHPYTKATTPTHYECVIRAVAGSVAHIEHRCGCYVAGATLTDDPRLSKREAAGAAAAAYQARLAARVLRRRGALN